MTQADTAVAIDRLRELAEAATPGPWAWEDRDLLNPAIREAHKRVIQDEPYEGQWIDPDSPDAAYIAAANPADLRSLITAYESQAERLREVEGAVSKIEADAQEARQLASDLDAMGPVAKEVDRGLQPAIYAQAARHDWLMDAVRKVRSALTQSPPATENGE